MGTIPPPGFTLLAARLPLVSVEVACAQAQRQVQLQRTLFAAVRQPKVEVLAHAFLALWASVCGMLTLPFDMLRAQHAAGVQAGALPRSLLESQRFEQQLGELEKLTLGPLARSV
jgi:hypothetical protein